MSINSNYPTPASGAIAGYHVVQQVTLDKNTGITSAAVASYVSKDLYSAGKSYVYMQVIQIVDLPGAQDGFEFAENALIEPIPVGANTAGNRYIFSGGILDTPTQPDTAQA